MIAPSRRRSSRADVVIGRNVRLWRMETGMSQAQLADRLGITFQQVQKYEVGINRMPTGRLVKLARVLGVHTSTFLDGVDSGNGERLARIRLFDDRRAYRLASAFAAIQNLSLRLRLVEMVEQIAAMPQSQRSLVGQVSRRKGCAPGA